LNTLPEVTVRTVTSKDCCGWTWALPVGPMSARQARRQVAETLGALDVPPEMVGDAEIMVSELATNAFRHAAGHGPHELWIFTPGQPHGDVAGPDAREIVCAVFDALPEPRLRADTAFCGDFGRGLSIVQELSGGRWGVQPARSRLHLGVRGYGVRGKAVWFGCPVPAAAVRRVGRMCADRRHLTVI
jgi:hypothetical protein